MTLPLCGRLVTTIYHVSMCDLGKSAAQERTAMVKVGSFNSACATANGHDLRSSFVVLVLAITKHTKEALQKRVNEPFRPVAPLDAPRASSMMTFASGLRFKIFQAIHAPLMPLPIMTKSADSGKSSVDRWSTMPSGGSCQYEVVGFARGNVGTILALSSMLNGF